MDFWDRSLGDFLLVTLFLGGGAAWLTGRATAIVWSAWWQLIAYLLLLTVAVRFIHFSLFEGAFFLPPENFPRALAGALVDFAVLLVLGGLGRTVTRAQQMRRQYRFLHQDSGSSG